jgi:hypothetical protein
MADFRMGMQNSRPMVLLIRGIQKGGIVVMRRIETNLPPEEVRQRLDEHIAPAPTLTTPFQKKLPLTKLIGKRRDNRFQIWPNTMIVMDPPSIRGQIEPDGSLTFRTGISWTAAITLGLLLIADLAFMKWVHASGQSPVLLLFGALVVPVALCTAGLHLVIQRSMLPDLERRFLGLFE